MLNAHIKKFMGAQYERVAKTLMIWAILLFALRSAEIKLEIAPIVVWLTTIFLTAGGFVQVLSSDDTIDSLRGQLMLPENSAQFHTAFFLSVAVYTLLTKAGLLLVGYFAVSKFQLSALIGFVGCFILSAVMTYLLAFRAEKRVTKYRYLKHMRHNFVFYLWRYLMNHRKYLANTVALWAFGLILAIVLGRSTFADFLPMGFVLMCLNTPLGILLSSDKALYRQVQLLPKQTTGLLLPYALFLAGINMIACAIYLTAWRIAVGNFSPLMFLFAALFSIISTGLTVTLEIQFPLLNWQVESDLWHHPRKYIVPGMMVIFALVITFLTGGF
jgi:hypothetical protein